MSRVLRRKDGYDSVADEESESFLEHVSVTSVKREWKKSCCCLACCFVLLLLVLVVAGGVAFLVLSLTTDLLKGSSTGTESSTISLKVNTTMVKRSGDWVTLYWDNVPHPSDSDWIGVYVPTKDGKIDAVNHAPVKYQFANVSATHLTSGAGSLEVQLINMRQDVIMGFFRNGLNASEKVATFTDPVAVAVSEVVQFEKVNEPLQGHLSLTTDPTEMRLVWVTKNSSEPTVKWGNLSGVYSNETQATSSTYMAEDMCGSPAIDFGYIDPGQIHNATMVGLIPGQQYYYIFGDDSYGWSDEFHFTAAPTPGPDVTTRIIAYGDLGTNNQDGMHQVRRGQPPSLNTTRWVMDRINETDLILHLGDISYGEGYLTVWDTFFHGIEGIATRVPYMVCIGNHERDWPQSGSFYNEDDSHGECGVPHLRRLAMPRPSTGEAWYGFDYGSVHFLLMSTEQNFTQGSQQYQFIQRHLQSVNRSRTPWLIFGGHRPMYVYGEKEGAKGNQTFQAVAQLMREHLEPLLKEYSVDVALWAHAHSYQRTCPVYRENCTGDSSNGTTHFIIGMAGQTLLDDQYFPYQKPAWINYFDHQTFGYFRLEANATTLSLEFVTGASRTVKDSLTLYKSQ